MMAETNSKVGKETGSVVAESDQRYVLDTNRTRKNTEKGLEYQMDQLKRTNKSLKRLENYLAEITEDDDEPLDVVRRKYCLWMQEYERFLELYEILSPQIDTNELEGVSIWFEESNSSTRQFKLNIENYITKRSKQALENQLEGQKFLPSETVNLDKELEAARLQEEVRTVWKEGIEDNMSVVSRMSRESRASSYASIKRIKEEQKKVEFQTRKLNMSKRKEIEMAKLALKLEEEELELDTNIAVSQAVSEVLVKYGSTENLATPVHVRTVPQLIDEPRFTSPGPTATHYPSSLMEERVEESLPPSFKGSIPSEPNNQAGMIQRVVQHLRKPVTEIKKFGGDPLEYQIFIRQFNAKVVANTEDDDERMNYLEQLTQDEAHNAVTGFGHLRGDRAYKAAMQQLEEHYGDDAVIATAFIRKALNWPSVRAGDAKALDEFALFLVECQNAVGADSRNVLEYSENIKRLMLKLPFHLHDRWRSQVFRLKESKKRVRFKDLTHFVKAEAKRVNDPTYGSIAMVTQTKDSSKRPFGKNKISQITNATSEVSTTKSESHSKCSYCDLKSHLLETCKKFVAKGLQERYNHLKEKGLCFGCLRRGHLSKNCRRRLTCNTCGKCHPSILHDDSKISTADKEQSQNPYKYSDTTIVSTSMEFTCNGGNHTGAGDVSCAMSIIPVRVKLKNKPHSIETYAFLDTGSTASFCTESVMRRLGANGKKTELTLSTMGEPYTMTTYSVSGLQVCDLDLKNLVDLPKVFTKKEMPVKRNHMPTQKEISKWEHLSEISLAEPNVEIGLMLGSNIPDAYAPTRILTGPSESPHATKTKLGWVVWKLLRDSGSVNVNRVHIQESENCIETMVKMSMNLDFPERLIDDKRERIPGKTKTS